MATDIGKLLSLVKQDHAVSDVRIQIGQQLYYLHQEFIKLRAPEILNLETDDIYAFDKILEFVYTDWIDMRDMNIDHIV